jgi:polyisoprenoid-binding protein YceI
MKLNTTHEVVNGTFHVQSGSITFDRTASHISGIVIVVAGSGKAGIDSRDKKMNKDILKVDQFAIVSFAPKTYNGTIAASGDSTIDVSGVFTLLGTAHELTIPMQLQTIGDSFPRWRRTGKLTHAVSLNLSESLDRLVYSI